MHSDGGACLLAEVEEEEEEGIVIGSVARRAESRLS